MRIIKQFIAIAIILFTVSIAVPTRAVNIYSIDTEQIDDGVFAVECSIKNDNKVKLMVQKDGTTLYYNLCRYKKREVFPLQLGNGSYTITVLENTRENRYKPVIQEMVEVESKDPLKVYLQTIQLIDWDYESHVVRKAAELTKNIKDNEEKVRVIYNHIIHNYNYDFEENEFAYDYVPNIEEIAKTKKGMCYDFSSLFASMLRSVGIPTKLVKGYGDKIKGYHAWNEVYLAGKWLIIDTSFDVQMFQDMRHASIFKDNSMYDKISEF